MSLERIQHYSSLLKTLTFQMKTERKAKYWWYWSSTGFYGNCSLKGETEGRQLNEWLTIWKIETSRWLKRLLTAPSAFFGCVPWPIVWVHLQFNSGTAGGSSWLKAFLSIYTSRMLGKPNQLRACSIYIHWLTSLLSTPLLSLWSV